MSHLLPANDMRPSHRGKRPLDDTDDEPEMPLVVHRIDHRQTGVAIEHNGPAFAPRPSGPPLFNVYQAILRHPNLFFQFTMRLSLEAIVHLYAIDKEFHYRFNKFSTSITHDYADYHAPQAAFVFSWVLFPELCISDPMLRPMDNRQHLARDIPSLRWAKMVLHRDNIVSSILTRLALEGLRVPQGSQTALMKFWLLMGTKTTEKRVAFLDNRTIWTDADIEFFFMFLIKLDMRFSHPIFGNGCCSLSHMLLTQKSLKTLSSLLCGRLILDYDELLAVISKTYRLEDLDVLNNPWLADLQFGGVLEGQWGFLSREMWDADGNALPPAIEMIAVEAVQRGLHLHRYFLDYMRFGFVGRDGKNVPTVRRWRGERDVLEKGEGWPTGKEWTETIRAMTAASVQDAD